MAKHASPTVVGAFVVGAVGIATAGTFAFSDLDVFAEELTYVAYFESAVTGLDVGAPIRFQGVRVGRISDIYAIYDEESKDIRIPVTLTFEEGAVRSPQDVLEQGIRSAQEAIGIMIERGLKAELMTDSFVTGKLFVGLEYHPERDARYVNEGIVPFPEMPTTVSEIDRFVKSVEELPLQEIAQDTREALQAFRDLASDPLIREVLGKVSSALDEVAPLAGSVQESLSEIQRLAANINEEVDPTSEELRTLLATLDGSVTRITESVEGAMDEAREALRPVDRILGRGQEIPFRFQEALDEVTNATRAFRSLVEYLERHPEALLRGKK